MDKHVEVRKHTKMIMDTFHSEHDNTAPTARVGPLKSHHSGLGRYSGGSRQTPTVQ